MAEFPPGFIGRIGDGFRKNHWFRPLKPRFWDKSREFCSTVIGFKPRPPGIFSHGFQSKSARGTQERAQIFLTGHLRRHSPLRNFFVPVPLERTSSRLSAKWATTKRGSTRQTKSLLMISWHFFGPFFDWFGFFCIVYFQGCVCFVFKSTLEFLHCFKLLSDFKAQLGYGMSTVQPI